MGVFDQNWAAVSQLRSQYQPRVTTLGDVMYGNREVAPARPLTALEILKADMAKRFSDPLRREQAMKIAAGEPQEVGGWRGLVGDVLGNPIVKTAMKPLELLDIPRRLVVSSVEEVSDMFNGNDASFNDWIKHVKDPTYGVGRWLDKGQQNDLGKWGSRIFGFVGDVLLDPLTYMSFGATKAASVLGAAGRQGRLVMAQRLIDKGVDVNRGLQVARKGRAILTADELQKLGLDRAGLYFMGKRIAGTENIAKAMMRTSASGRIFVADALRGTKVMELFDPQDAAAARKAILRGTAPPERAKEYFDMVTARNFERSAWSLAMREGGRDFTKILKAMDQSELESVRNTVYRVLEGATDDVSEAELRIAQPIADMYKKMAESIRADYRLIDPEGGFGNIDTGYFPHMRTREAIKFMQTDGTKFVDELRRVIDNPVETMGVFKNRMVAGDDFFGVVLTEEDIAGGVRRLNEIAREGGFVGDFFETDIVQVTSKYIAQWAEQKGVAAYMKHLFDSGTAQSLAARSMPDEKTIAKAMKVIQRAETNHAKNIASAADRLTKIRSTLMEFANRQADNMEADVYDLRVSDDLAMSLDSSRARLVQEASEIADELALARSAFDDVMGMTVRAAGPTPVEPLTYKALTEVLYSKEQQLRRIAEDVKNARANWQRILPEISDMTEWARRFEERSAIIRERAEVIDRLVTAAINGDPTTEARKAAMTATRAGLAGGSGARVYKKQADRIVSSLNFENAVALSGGNMLDAMRAARSGGNLTEQQAASFGDWWKRAMGNLPISDNDFKNMSVQKVGEIVGASVRGDATIHEQRVAALWMIARATFNGEGMADDVADIIRPLLLAQGDESSDLLSRAAFADEWFKNFAKKEKDFSRLSRLDSIHTNVSKVREEVEVAIRRYAAVAALLDNMSALTPSWLSLQGGGELVANITEEALDTMLQGKFAALRGLFDDFLPNDVDPRLGASVEELMMPSSASGARIDVGSTGRKVAPAADVAPDRMVPASAAESARRVDAVRGGKKVSSAAPDVAQQGAGNAPRELTLQEFMRVLERYRDEAEGMFWQFEVATKGQANLLLQKNRPVVAVLDEAMEIEAGMAGAGRVSPTGKRTNTLQTAVRGGGTAFDRPESTVSFADIIADIEERILVDGIDFSDSLVNDLVAERLSGFDDAIDEMRRDLTRYRITDRNGRKMRHTIDETRDEMSSTLMRLWLATTVDERMGRVAEVLAPYGLVPTEDMFRRVVNGVAGLQSAEMAVQISARRDMQSALARITERVGKVSDPNESRAIIKEELDALLASNPAASKMLHRLGGESNARHYYERWIDVGGATGSGRKRTLAETRRQAGATNITRIEKQLKSVEKRIAALGESGDPTPLKAEADRLRAELQAAQDAAEKSPQFSEVVKKTAQLKEDRAKVKEDIVRWWRDITGEDRVPTVGEINEFLKTHMNTAGHWDEDGSTIRQQMQWVRYVQERIESGSSKTRVTQSWLRAAADPFVDPSKIMSGTRQGQNLPSSYATWIRAYADRLAVLEPKAKELMEEAGLATGEVARREARAETVSRRARAVRGGVSVKAAFGSKNAAESFTADWTYSAERARASLARYNEMIDSPQYAAAVQRKGENDILEVLAEFDTAGVPIAIANNTSAADVARRMVEAGDVVFYQSLNDEIAPVRLTPQWFTKEDYGPVGGYFYVQDDSGTVSLAREYGAVGLSARKQVEPSADARKALSRIEKARKNAVAAMKRQEAKVAEARVRAEQTGSRSRAASLKRAQSNLDIARRGMERAQAKIANMPDGPEATRIIFEAQERVNAAADALAKAQAVRFTAEDDVLRREVDELDRLKRIESNGRIQITPSIEAVEVVGESVEGAVRKPIVFTDVEWRSLWNHKKSRGGIATALKRVEDGIKELQAERGKLVDELAAGQGKRTRSVALRQKMFDVEDRIALIDEEISEATRRASDLRLEYDSLDDVVRSAALQKIEFIREAVKRGDVSVEGIRSAMRERTLTIGSKGGAGAFAENAATRQSYLRSIWESTEDSRFLSEVDRLRESSELQFARSLMDDEETTFQLAVAARLAADSAWDKAFAARKEVVDVGLDAAAKVQPMVTAMGGDPAVVAQVKKVFDDGMAGVQEGTKTVEQVFRDIAAIGEAARPKAKPLVEPSPAELATRDARLAAKKEKLRSRRKRMAAVVAKFNKADKAAKQLAAEVDDLTRRVGERRNRFYQWKIRELEERAATVRNTRDRLNEKMTELADIAWQYEHTRWTMRNSVGEDVLPTLRNRLEGVKWAIGSMEGMPAPQNIDEMKRFVAEAEELIKVLEDGGDDVSDIARLLADEKIKLYDLITSNVDLSDMRAISDDTIASIPRLLEEGWTTLGNIGLPNVVVRDEVWKMLQNMKRLNQPAITRELGKFIGGYTRFFKAYATLSPGFHIRNALSNSFMLVAAGADVRLFRKSFSLARGYVEAFSGGDETLAAFLNAMPSDERAIFEAALKATDAAGGGRTFEAFQGFMPKRNKLKSNFALRGSDAVGTQVEFTSRFMLSYDTIVQGMKAGARNGQTFTPDELFTQAAARTKKFLIDYTDRGVADEALTNIIPFWMWMSRNLPLQLINQWTNPKAYAIYGSLMRNLGLDDEDEVVPSWLKEQGAVKIATDWYLSPDLGFNRLNQQVKEMADPTRLLSYMNPALRVPLELTGNRRLYNNVPFSDKPQDIAGGPMSALVEALLRLAGQTKTAADGTSMTSDKANYALLNMLPFLSQAERLVPATDPYKARQAGSWLSYFGVPVRQVTPQMRESELKRRQRAIEQFARQLEQLGYTA